MILDIPTAVQVNHTLDDQTRQTVLLLYGALIAGVMLAVILGRRL